MVLNESTRGAADLLVSSLGPIMLIVISILVLYVVIRLVFLRPPPESKPSQETHGEYLR